MASPSAKDIRQKVVAAALTLAAARPWAQVSLADIAAAAQLPLTTLHDHFEDRFDIIAAWGRLLDRKTLAATTAPDGNESPRDRLFAILMDRFDALNENRAGAVSILRSLRTDPEQTIIGLPHLGRSMSWMLEAAGIETAGLKGGLKIAGLTALYLKTLWAWCDDDNEDLAKTMAALDQNLGQAELWAQRLGMDN